MLRYTIEGHGGAVIPSGNGYDVVCPKCGKSQRAIVASGSNPNAHNKVNGDGTVDFMCDNEEVPVKDEDGELVEGALESCGFTVIGSKLVGNL
jgi:hypothetical protein